MIYKAYKFTSKNQVNSLLLIAEPFEYITREIIESNDIDIVNEYSPGYYVIAVWKDVEHSSWQQYTILNSNSPIWWSGISLIAPENNQFVPNEVTNFQARAAMRAYILPDGRSLETAIKELLLSNKEATQVLAESNPLRISADNAWLAWEQSNTFLRNSDMVNAMASQLGFTSKQIDDLFIYAYSLSA